MTRALLALALCGCAATPSLEQQVANMPDHRLCWNAAYARTYQAQLVARAEVSRRQLTCTPEMIAAYEREREFALRQSAARDAATNQAIDNIIRSRQPQPQPAQGTHTYIINGQTVTCTTNGTVTNCY